MNTIHTMTVGMSAMAAKTITETDIYLFAGITGDMNPAHINQQYSSQTRFKSRIAHGMLSAGLISAVIGMQLPGPGTIYVEQNLKFKAPVYIGDTVTAMVVVKEIDQERNRAILETTCVNQDGVKLIDGEAVVMPPKVSH